MDKMPRRSKYFRSDYSKYHSEPCWNGVCVPMSGGYHFLIDSEDFELVTSGGRKWQPKPGRHTMYAWSSTSPKYRGVHRMILDVPQGMVGDHINHNGLDNRRCNIRIATYSQNLMNSNNKKRKAIRYRGVRKIPNSPSWFAEVSYGGNSFRQGPFRTEVEAALAFNAMASHHYGEFATLNNLGAEYVQ